MRVSASLRSCLLLIIIVLGIFSVFAWKPVHLGFSSGNTIVVPDNYASISGAVSNAADGDTIFVKSGVYNESEIFVDKSLTIIGEDMDNTVIDGGGTAQSILQITADNVVVENLTLRNTDVSSTAPAIRLIDVVNSTITKNVLKNLGHGVELMRSNFSSISKNVIYNATEGIRIRDNSCNNTIRGNTIENNSIGMEITDLSSEYNRVYHNNFVNNLNKIPLFTSPNYFDNGYPSGGNYWSDNTEVDDLSSGAYQNETGSDGILDNGYPYLSSDRYPFSYPLSEVEVTAGGSVWSLQISTNSTFTSNFLNASAKSINFTIQSDPPNNGSFRIHIPKGLLRCDSLGEWKVSAVYLDGTVVELLPWAGSDSEDTYLYFTYSQSDISEIQIKGTIFLSEFPISILIVIFVLATATIIVHRKIVKPRKSKSLKIF
jgi:parallel beta-helix repeat protein